MGKLYIFEGHDGAGKTTIASGVAKRIGAKYKHFYDDFDVKYDIEPLSIPEDELISKVKKVLDSILKGDEVVVMDRGIITPLSVISKDKWSEMSDYFDKIPTTLCYADLDTTVKRLKEREIDESKQWDNQKWISKNLEIAKYFDLNVVNTSTEKTKEENIKIALDIINNA